MTTSWRDLILKEFTPEVARLTLVADPDGLLLEEGLLQGIRARGFELIPFEDHIAFRFAYESKFRSRWDRGEPTELVVVLRAESSDLNSLPYDLLQAGRKLAFSLGDIFPNLSYPVLDGLDRSDLDALHQAQIQHSPGNLGDNATKDFILQHVFEIAPGAIRTATDLMRVLLRRHYRKQNLPDILDQRLIDLLRTGGRFGDWPLDQIVPDRGAFLAFLQERWPTFLDRMASKDGKEIRERPSEYSLKYGGPVDLPFDHDDVRVYLDNLFVEGILTPVSHARSDRLVRHWVRVGVRTQPAEDRLLRLQALIKVLKETVPETSARHQEWFDFAYRWAEAVALHASSEAKAPDSVQTGFISIRSDIDGAFLAWLQARYAGLHNQPPVPPVMVHHIPRALARSVEAGTCQRVALVIVDGLALDQWVVMRDVLTDQCPELRFDESAVFAWLPTTTSVSRQAAFAGKAPLYFPTSIQGTERESRHWSQFWLDHGLTQRNVSYAKCLSDADFHRVAEVAADDAVRAMGVVIGKVDRIMHGMELGTEGMHNQIRQWALGGQVAGLLKVLVARGFAVTMSSDHGNIEVQGCGSPSEGRVADLRGERVRIYPDASLRTRVHKDYPDAIEWPCIGLPDHFLPLFAPDRRAFVREGEQIVAHGGLALEETVVPLVQVSRREP